MTDDDADEVNDDESDANNINNSIKHMTPTNSKETLTWIGEPKFDTISNSSPN